MNNASADLIAGPGVRTGIKRVILPEPPGGDPGKYQAQIDFSPGQKDGGSASNCS
jgi:hypothetical protein